MILKRKQNWVMSYIYIATFGSFIGYSAASLADKDAIPRDHHRICLSRPAGWLGYPLIRWYPLGQGRRRESDVLGFHRDVLRGARRDVLLGAKELCRLPHHVSGSFTLTGVGNGSTYMTICAIFRAEKLHEAEGKGETARAPALKQAGLEAGAALGFIGAVGSVAASSSRAGSAPPLPQTVGPISRL